MALTPTQKLEEAPKISWSETSVKAAIAGVACAVVSSLLNPFDVTKIRLQNQTNSAVREYKSFRHGLLKIFADEGIAGLSRGLPASICRELSYSSIRIGMYEPIRLLLYDITGSSSSPVVKFLSALLSGAIGAYIATPFDLIKTRFQAELPLARSSSGVVGVGGNPGVAVVSTFQALQSVHHLEGWRGLYKGWQVTTLRAAILTSAQLGSYDTIKNNVLIDYFQMENGYFLHLCASLTAGLITTTATNPVDVVKTRYLSDKQKLYRNPIHCAFHILRADGFTGFFKGWTPSYWRLGPHTVMSFILIEKIRAVCGLPPI